MAASTETLSHSANNPNDEPNPNDCKNGTLKELEKDISSQLLYPEKFTECYQQNSLLNVKNKPTSTPENKGNKTVHVPPSSVLSRLKAFLPEMVNSNKDLASQITACPENEHKFDIENVKDGDTHIEMNVCLVQDKYLTNGSSDEESEDSSDSDTSVSGNTSNEEEMMKEIRLKKKKTKKKPSIQELDSTDFEVSNG